MATFKIIDLSGDEEYETAGTMIEAARGQIDTSIGSNLSTATGSGYYAIQAARFVIWELRLLSADIRREIRRSA